MPLGGAARASARSAARMSSDTTFGVICIRLALCQKVANFRQQLFALCRGGLLFLKAGNALELADLTHDQKQNESNDQEIDRDRQKLPIAKDSASFLRVRVSRMPLDRGRQRNIGVREIEPAGDRADHRHDHVADEGIDDLAEGGADDDADRKVDHIAAQGEFPELRKHGILSSGAAGLEVASKVRYYAGTGWRLRR